MFVPRFFFHIQDSVVLKDQEGTDLPNLQAARLQAVSMAGQLLVDHPETFLVDGRWTVEIHEGGVTRSTLEFLGRDSIE